MLVLTIVVHGHEKFRLHTLHSTGLAWSMEFQPKTSVPGGHDLTQISGVEIQGSSSVPPAYTVCAPRQHGEKKRESNRRAGAASKSKRMAVHSHLGTSSPPLLDNQHM